MTASSDDLSKKIITVLGASDEINVKKLRKQILLQLQTDSDDKAAKKSFKTTIQALEAEGKLTLDSDGTVKLKKIKKDKKDKKDKKKKDKKEKKRKKNVDDSQDIEEEEEVETKKQKTEQDEDHSENDEIIVEVKEAVDKEKNVPCKGNPSGYTRLFLGNLPFVVDEASLRDFFSPAIMTHVKWITDKETGKFYGSAFVEMKTSKDGAIAVTEKNGEKLVSIVFFLSASFYACIYLMLFSYIMC
jgi:hypothetical protein